MTSNVPTTRCCWKCWPAPTVSIRGRMRAEVAAIHRGSSTAASRACASASSGKALATAVGRPPSTPRCKAAAELFRKLGATVDEISIPMHLAGPAIWLPIAAEGAHRVHDEGQRHGHQLARSLQHQRCSTPIRGWKQRADELSDTLKITMLLGQYFIKHYRGHFYAKAQNLSRKLRAAYDAALGKYDLLLMPTLPMKATPLPPAGRAARALYPARASRWCRTRRRSTSRPSGDEPALRHERRFADRVDADRQVFRRSRPSIAPPPPSRAPATGPRCK